MKRFWLLLLTLFVLFFWFVNASNFSYTYTISPNWTNNAWESQGMWFYVTNSVQLLSVLKSTWSVCPIWVIRSWNIVWTYNAPILYTGVVSGNYVYFTNAFLTGWLYYSIEAWSWNWFTGYSTANSCNHDYNYSWWPTEKSKIFRRSWFFNSLAFSNRSYIQLFNTNVYWYDIRTFNFSWTYPDLSHCPLPSTWYNLHANGEVYPFSGDIYLTGWYWFVSTLSGAWYSIIAWNASSNVIWNGFSFPYTWLNMIIDGNIPNVYQSWGVLYAMNRNNSLPWSWWVLDITGTYQESVGNVQLNFVQSITSLLVSNLWKIIIAMWAIFLARILLKLFGINTRRKKSIY